MHDYRNDPIELENVRDWLLLAFITAFFATIYLNIGPIISYSLTLFGDDGTSYYQNLITYLKSKPKLLYNINIVGKILYCYLFRIFFAIAICSGRSQTFPKILFNHLHKCSYLGMIIILICPISYDSIEIVHDFAVFNNILFVIGLSLVIYSTTLFAFYFVVTFDFGQEVDFVVITQYLIACALLASSISYALSYYKIHILFHDYPLNLRHYYYLLTRHGNMIMTGLNILLIQVTWIFLAIVLKPLNRRYNYFDISVIILYSIVMCSSLLIHIYKGIDDFIIKKFFYIFELYILRIFLFLIAFSVMTYIATVKVKPNSKRALIKSSLMASILFCCVLLPVGFFLGVHTSSFAKPCQNASNIAIIVAVISFLDFYGTKINYEIVRCGLRYYIISWFIIIIGNILITFAPQDVSEILSYNEYYMFLKAMILLISQIGIYTLFGYMIYLLKSNSLHKQQSN